MKKPSLKSLKNKLWKNILRVGSISAKEALALANPAYKLHLTNMVAARKEANRAKVKYDSMKVLAEMRRTQESTRRAEINLR